MPKHSRRFFRLPDRVAKSTERSFQTLEIVIASVMLALIAFNSTLVGIAFTKLSRPRITKPSSGDEPINQLVNMLNSNQESIADYTKTTLSLVVSLSAIMGVLIFIMIRTGIKSDQLKIKINEAESKYKDMYFINSVNDVYKEISQKILSNQSSKTLNIHVLALTLHQITHLFDDWHRAERLKNIHFSLYHINPSYIDRSPNLKSNWRSKYNLNRETIDAWLGDYGEELTKNNVTIDFYPYNHLPAINGIIMGDTYYISLSSWDNHYQIRDSDNAKYIRLLPEDSSNLAKYLREIFDNWLDRARTSPNI